MEKKKKKKEELIKEDLFELKGRAAIIEKLIPCCLFICCMKLYSFEKLLSSKCSQIMLVSVAELVWFTL